MVQRTGQPVDNSQSLTRNAERNQISENMFERGGGGGGGFGGAIEEERKEDHQEGTRS